MASNPVHKLTEEEYLAVERAAEIRSEFYGGEMFAMSGGTMAHSILGSNFLAELHLSLKGRPCIVFNPDMRIKVVKTGLYAYPDLSVVRGRPLFADDKKDSLVNPSLIVEVLSPSTESYDRGRKFEHYRSIETLRDYILVSQDRVLVEHYARREAAAWLLRVYSLLEEELRIDSVSVAIPLSAIYRGIEFVE
ncbi:MAG: Uma2 family endonuclease [Bryobacterales bacterium]|nr:Uma2 family endonuclease [Bryobacterales bacterium]